MDSRLLKGGAWSLSGKIGSLGMAALTLPLLARMLPPAEFGGYIFAVSMTMLLSTIGTLGLNVSLVRRTASQLSAGRTKEARCEIRRSLWLAAAGATLIFGISYTAIS